jgi:hypothetical protein
MRMNKLLYAIPFYLIAQMAIAGYPGETVTEEKDAEPNWDAAEYACPKIITSRKGEHAFCCARIYGYSLRYGKWNNIVPESKKHIRYRFDPEKEEAYLSCHYFGLEGTGFRIQAKGAIACNDKRGVCWKTNPYIVK